jgi:hypothetical protein
MSKRTQKPARLTVARPTVYGALLADIKARVKRARVRAGLAANRELLRLYWDIGRLILDRQDREGWGAKVIDRLSRDLQRAFPGQQGFSPRNLKYMRAFAEAWPAFEIVQQAAAQLDPQQTEAGKVQPVAAQISSGPIVQAPLAQLSWYHHLLLPKALKGAVPSVADLERELTEE